MKKKIAPKEQGLWELLILAHRKGIRIVLAGPTGHGKTQTIEAFCRKYGKKLIYLNIPTLLPSDLGIMPMVDQVNRSVYYAKPWWVDLVTDPQEGSNYVLFLDEINRNDKDMFNACMRIMTGAYDEKPIYSYIVGACNVNDLEDENTVLYDVQEFDPAHRRRFWIVKWEVSFNEFETYFYNNIATHSVVLDFIHYERTQGNNIYMCPIAGGEQFSPARIVELHHLISEAENLKINWMAHPMFVSCLHETLGSQLTQKFLHFVVNQAITLKDILEKTEKVFQTPSVIVSRVMANCLYHHFSEQLVNSIAFIMEKINFTKELEQWYTLGEALIKTYHLWSTVKGTNTSILEKIKVAFEVNIGNELDFEDNKM